MCPICHQVKENKSCNPDRACSQDHTIKDYYLQKRYNELICGFTLDHIQRKQVETMFNALVAFIESQTKIIPLKRLNHKFLFQKFLSFCFLLKKTYHLQNKRIKKIKCFGTLFLYIIILTLTFPETPTVTKNKPAINYVNLSIHAVSKWKPRGILTR